MPKARFRRSVCLFSHRRPLGRIFVGYTRDIHGVFMGYTYVSGMCRVCIGYVSGMCRRRRGAKQGMLLTTDGHGFARKHGDVINDNIDNLRPNQYYLGAKRSRLLTTDEHGFARKHEIYILGSVKVSGVQWLKYNRGKMFLSGRYTNHGRARMDTETRRCN